MQEQFGIGAFRSRQQVMRFDSALRRAGVATQVISTPHEVSVGCGLSVQFDLSDTQTVLETYRRARPGNLIGFYRVMPVPGGRPTIARL